MALDGDPRRSASHDNLMGHLAGPLLAGTTQTTLPLTVAGGGVTATVDWVSRQPVLLIGTRIALEERAVVVTVQVTPRRDVPASSATVRLAPFSEAGAFLPVWPPAPLPIPDAAPALDVVVTATGVQPSELAQLIEVRLVEGVLGRLLYVVGAEKQRLRRQARELLALRQLSFVFDPADPEHRRMGQALDRLGADLGVPRFTDRLAWDAGQRQPISLSAREGDESYRQRLKIYRPFLQPNRRRVEDAMAAVGVDAAIQEPNSEFAVAIKLISSPDDTARRALLDWLRANQLMQPGSTIPASRTLPSLVRAKQQAILNRLFVNFTFPAGAFVAPLLASALDRAGRCRAALGVTRRWAVLRAQEDGGGSRYELGLGVDVETPPAAELDTMAQNLTNGRITTRTDLETQQLLDSLTPVPPAQDPVGRWFLQPCGFTTVHELPNSRWYLSHFPVVGTVISSPADAALSFEAHFDAPGDPGQDVVLWNGLRDAVADATAAGVPKWTESPSSAQLWTGATVPPAPALATFAAARLGTPDNEADLARTRSALNEMPRELLTTLVLDNAMSAGLLAGAAAQTQQLKALVDSLRRREVPSALPLVRGSQVLLVVGAAVLPGAGTPFSSRRVGFRWYVLPISGVAGTLDRTVGARNRYTPPGATGLAAVVAVSLARSDRDDPRGLVRPYEVRVELPDDTLIDLPTYERLMNLLERAVPLGVVVDTRNVREQHVDPAGDHAVVPLTGRLAHTFRLFRQRRHLGFLNDDE